MHIQQINYKEKNELIYKYLHQFEEVSSLFSYHPLSSESLKARASSLDKQPRFNREELKDVLLDYNKEVGNSEQSLKQIEKLSDPTSKVVIGGQQAGLLTGPLYSIYKAIQVIQMANNAEKELGTPVLPVFWIAGEDHDWNEVNHVYQLNSEGKIKQHKLKYKLNGKPSVSHISVSNEILHQFVEEVTSEWNQTENKEQLKNRLLQYANESSTLTHFFAKTMVYLFGEYGLVLIDSADVKFRSLQSSYFEKMIESNVELHRALLDSEKSFRAMGFSPQIELEENQSHLFVYSDDDRKLLERDGEQFVSKDKSVAFSKDRLLTIARNEPQKLSTNVVFRALMQELVFPTLIFVGGTSEVSYWALYKKMFEVLQLELPIITPRVGYTLIDRTSQKCMEKYGISYEQLLYDLHFLKEKWFSEQDELQLDDKFEQLRQHIVLGYTEVMPSLQQINEHMSDLGTKNLERILNEVTYIEKRAIQTYRLKFDVTLGHFDRMKLLYEPDGKLQERVYHPFYFINEFGTEWISTLINSPINYEKQHFMLIL